MQVRRAVPGDEPILRWLRIEALTDTPSVFGSTLDRERSRTEDEWRHWIEPGPMWLLEDDGTPLGLTGIHVLPDAPAEVVSVWVQAQARGTGAAESLMRAAMAWAAEEGIELALHVTEGNDQAQRFYERLGFVLTGDTEVRDHDGVVEREMRLPT